ncbi:PKD domain-containing protein [Phorcysia thermohydrogeniphila]|uniref:EF-hand domain-containing protein n=1 Tax=Phorcysia thermohydrogeniphila TaxID=936138 RepID=A0A4R1GIE9_9BACT|nr:hypothetical protein [Phorcysia thermohydrogeniphila]TCK04022.1 hypothetical protein CLV27_1339 [Phorcysia thermohydrogeniphila]
MKRWWKAFPVFLLFFAFSCGASIKEEETPPPPQEVPTVTTDLAGSVKALNRGEEEKVSAARVKLIVDFNRNGVFEGKHSEDKIYLSATLNGEFFIKSIEIPEQGALAELIVEKEGYAPYYKVLELSPNSELNVNVELLPVSVEVQPVLRSLRGLEVGNSEVKVDFSPLAIEEDTTLLNVFYKNYNLEGELPQAPGKLEIDGRPLEVLSLLSLELKNQRGEVVEFADEFTCPYTIRQKLSPKAIEEIRKNGDVDPKSGCQVPVYYFSSETGKWRYLGNGDIVDSSGGAVDCSSLQDGSSYWVKLCGKQGEGVTFYAVAYPLKESEVTVCFFTENESGEPVAGASFEVFKGGFYSVAFSNEEGIARLQVPFTKRPSNCSSLGEEATSEGITFRYFEPSSLSMPVSLDLSALPSGSLSGCSCLFRVKVPSSTVDAIVVARDSSGYPVKEAEVCLKERNFGFYECRKTDENGMATFKVVPEKVYTAFGVGLSSVTKEVTPLDRFFSLTLTNTPPKVEMTVYPKEVKAGSNLYILLYAYDPDGDEIRLKDFMCGDKRARVIEGEDFEGALFVTAYCTPTEPGSYKVSANVGDAFEMFKVEEEFNVVSGSSPPVINGYNFLDSDGKVVSRDSLKVGNIYKLVFYAYDPDGDPISYRSANPYCSFEVNEKGVATCSFPSSGDYELSFVIDDRNGNSVEERINVHVSDGETLQIVSLNLEPDIFQSGDTLRVRALVYAPQLERVYATLLEGERVLIPSQDCGKTAEGYFECLLEGALNFGEGEHLLTVKVEGGSSVTSGTVSLFAGISNLPPKFLLPLPPRLELEAGVPFKFKVRALDPDGDKLSYTWLINGEKVFSGDNDFYYTFDSSGVYKVGVVVSDGKDVIYSSSEVTVVNLDAGRQMVVHLGAEGIYATLYSDDYSYVDTKVSGEFGAVYFGKLPTSGLNLAVTIPPEVIVPKGVAFEYLVATVAKEKCPAGECEDVLDKAFSWIASRRIPKDELGSWRLKITDENLDGFVDEEEVYRSFGRLYDQDKDGKVSYKELTGKVRVKTFVLRNVEGKQYFLNDFVDSFWKEMMPVSLGGFRRVQVVVENTPSEASLKVIGAEGSCVSEGEKVLCDLSVPLQDNGFFSFILFDESSKKAYTVRDLDTSSFILDYGEFVPPKSFGVVGLDAGEKVEVFASYSENVYSLLSTEVDGTYQVSQHRLGSGYFANFSLTRPKEDGVKVEMVNNYFLGDSLPDYLKVEQLRGELLEVDISYHPNDREAVLEGVDISSVNAFSASETCTFGDYSFELSMEGELEGASFPLPQMEKVVPPAVYSYISEACNNVNSSHYVELTVKKSEKDGFESALYLKKVLQ